MHDRKPAPAVAALLARQLVRWEVEPRATVPHPGGAPCIALSELPGAGAQAIGRQAAEWLDYGFFDGETLLAIARDPALVASLDPGLDPGAGASPLRTRVVWTLGERGMSVVLSGGAAFLMPAERALRVLVIAPTALRVARWAERHAVSDAVAAARLATEEQQRSRFLREQLGVDPAVHEHFDLVVNTERLGSQAAARILIEALRRRFPAATPG